MLSAMFEILFKRNIGNEPLIQRFMKGIFHVKPALPRYNMTWNVNLVLRFLQNLPTDSSITLRLLSIKLATLLALTTGLRCQTLSLIDIDNIEFSSESLKIRIMDILKQSKPNRHVAELYIEAYPDARICVLKTMAQYLENTKVFRKSSKLFLITQKPHNPASRSTIAS